MISYAYVLLFLLCGHVCYTDIRERIIKNHTTFFMAIVSVCIAFLSSGELNVIPAIIIIIVGFMLSVANVLGAGDVKLVAALSLSLSGDVTLNFLFLTTLVGLPVALVTLIISRYFHRYALVKGKTTVPYGVAIVGGYLMTFILLRGAA